MQQAPDQAVPARAGPTTGPPLSVREQLAAFVACVFAPADLVEIRRLPIRISVWQRADALTGLAEKLATQNASGQNVYVGANPRKSKGGKDRQSVALARCLIADFDKVSLADVRRRLADSKLPPPTLLLASGHGFHVYWRLAEPIADLAVWTALQKGLIALLGSDPAIHDPPRIMRLPGFQNVKDRANPKPCEVVEWDAARIYHQCDVCEIIPARPTAAPETASATPPASNGKAGVADAVGEMLRMKIEDRGDGSRRLLAAACRAADARLDDEHALSAVREYERLRPFARAWSDAEILTRVHDARAKVSPGKPGETANPSPKEIIAKDASEYTPRAVQWLWPGRIPIGKLTVIAGDPKVGKSFLTVFLAATVSVGGKWPGPASQWSQRGNVLILSAEDDPEDTIVPRLIAAGADLARVKIIEGVRDPWQADGEPFRLDEHLHELERFLDMTPEVRLVSIDPVSAFMGETNSHNNAEVRAVLHPLAKLAAARNIAVVAVSHLNKSSVNSPKAMYRTQGSLAFTAAARAIWYVIPDPEDKRRRLFLPAGMNLAEAPGGLAYRIKGGERGPMLEWEAERVDLDADEGLNAENAAPRRETATDRAETWLRTKLAGGPMLVKELEAEAGAIGFSLHVLRAAREKIGVIPAQVRDESKVTAWQISLPGAVA